MKILLTTLASVLCAVQASALAPSMSEGADPQVRAASELAMRLLPRHGDEIEFVSTQADTDTYTIEDGGGHVRISGNNANSMAVGLNTYLNECCNVTVSWYARDAVREPRRLPLPESPITRNALLRDRFFLNYCTFGYSLAWWRWEDWERLIDWMALNGVTMALANTGQEAIWQQVWSDFGMSADETREYFTGAAYLPWHRMSNIDSWHGPLPQSWIDSQLELQKRIVARETELGISPILGSFNGHVPGKLKELFPEADIRRLSKWSGFPEDYSCWYLSPTDPLFVKIQTAFLTKQRELLGDVSHIYGVDPFNEVDPPSWEPEYLAEAARMTYDAMAQSDPEAIWLQMGWLFFYMKDKWTPERVEAYLSPVPKGKLLMLDYYCEDTEVYRETDSFHGQDFIWSYLGNFGGNTMISGDLLDVERRIDHAFAEAGNGFVGIGGTLEGLGVDPPMWEYVLSRAWEGGVRGMDYIEKVADRHSGRKDTEYREAWKVLGANCHRQKSRDRAMTVPARPNMEGWSKWRKTYCYDNDSLGIAWGHLVRSKRSDDASYRFDCVNIARQWLENEFTGQFQNAVAAYKSGNAEGLSQSSERMLEILDDLDMLCATDSYFLLGKWISDARSHGTTPEEKEWFERDARLLLTCWGQKGSGLTDYAGRSYSGLIKNYYKPRWEHFLSGLHNALDSGSQYDIKAFNRWSFEFEWNWATEDRTVYPALPQGNPVKASRKLYKKYFN